MSRRFNIDPVSDLRVLADNLAQVAHDVRRTVKSVNEIADGVRDLYGNVVHPIVEYLKSMQAGHR